MQKDTTRAPAIATAAGERRLYGALESWRGICACMVVLWHVPAVGPIPLTGLVRGSYLFTDFFFVLSGFIIFENYHDRLRNGFGLGRFMMLRFGRLYPLHLFVLALFVLDEFARLGREGSGGGVRAAFTDPNSLDSLWLHLGLLNAHGFYPVNSWNFPSWSIGAEFYTYLLFALVILIAASALSYALATIFAGCMVVLLLSGRPNLDIAHDLGFVRCAAGFALGALCQRFMARSGWSAARLGTAATTAEVLLLALVFAFVALTGENRMSFAAPLLFAAVILVFAAEAGAVSRVLGTPPFRYVGTISYSVYMVHVFLIIHITSMADSIERISGIDLTSPGRDPTVAPVDLGATPWQGAVWIGSVLILVLIASASVYRLVELPSRRLSRRIAMHIGG